MAIIAVADYKTWKGISATTWDAQLAVIVPQAIAEFQTYTGRTIDSATLTEKYNGEDSPQIVLKTRPVASITSVTLTTPAGTSITIPSTAYAIDLESGVLKFDPPNSNPLASWWGNWPEMLPGVMQQFPVFPKGHQNITVVYVAGYASNAYPADMQAALYQWVDVLLGNAINSVGASILNSETLGNYKYERRSLAEMLEIKRQLFGPYRNMIA